MITHIEPGDAHRYYCETCETEYEIQLEPKVAEMKEKPEMDSKVPTTCPFCASDKFQEC